MRDTGGTLGAIGSMNETSEWWDKILHKLFLSSEYSTSTITIRMHTCTCINTLSVKETNTYVIGYSDKVCTTVCICVCANGCALIEMR